MADDENSIDLNLYVDLFSLPRPRNPDLTLSLPTFQRNYSLSNALHALEPLQLDPLHVADDSPALDPSLSARLLEQGAHASDAPASTGPDQPSFSHSPIGPILQWHDEAAAFINQCPTPMIELMSWSDRSSSRHGLLDCPELRFQRSFESNNRLRPRSSRMSGGEGFDSQTSPAQLMHDVMQSHRNLELEAYKKGNLHGPCKGTEGLEKEKAKEKEEESAADFECNICLDMAKEPVVTPCGHLFCWPCLYQWFHANPVFPECPVCKGEVDETNLTPIYGRGGSDTNKVCGEDGNSELKLPPRPRAHRIESFWRSMDRSFVGERDTAWRRIEDLRNAIRFGEDLGPSLQLRFNASDHAFVHRLSQWSMQREERSGSNIMGFRLPTITEPNPRINSTNSLTSDGFNHYESTGGLHAGLTRRFAVRGPLSPLNSHGHEPLPWRPTVQSTPTIEQASPPSTVAVITGDSTATDISAESNREASSRSLRRRGRSSNSGSLNVDEGASHSHRMRRLN